MVVRTFLIGDAHGHADLVRRLLEEIRPRAGDGDRLVFLGDLINRGPDARGVVDAVLQERERWPGPVVALLGNHELEFRWALRERSRDGWRSCLKVMKAATTAESYGVGFPYELDAVLAALPSGHRRLLFEELLPFWEDEHCVAVHGGIPEGMRPSQCSEEVLTGFVSDHRVYDYGKPIVFGHSPQPGNRPLNLLDRIGLDTGCGTKGGPLTAVMLPEPEFLSVRCGL